MEKRILINRWLGPDADSIAIYDEASVSSARQRVRDAGKRAHLSTELVESVALIASELTHNQLRHSKQGYFAVRSVERQSAKGLEIIAADSGPGIENPTRAITQETPSATSLGAGLGAVFRIADEVELDNRMEEGVCVIARKFDSRAAPSVCEVAIMGKPYPGEAISGDDGVLLHSESGFLAAVSDGLGHGPEARLASNRAIEVISRNRHMELEQLVITLNQELVRTRGCAISIARFTRNNGMLEAMSLGDVYTHLYKLRDAHFFTAIPLILGAGDFRKQRIRLEKQPVEPGSVLVMFTDGLKSRTSLKGQLDVLRQSTIAIADHLMENHSRPDDDALVLVARIPW